MKNLIILSILLFSFSLYSQQYKKVYETEKTVGSDGRIYVVKTPVLIPINQPQRKKTVVVAENDMRSSVYNDSYRYNRTQFNSERNVVFLNTNNTERFVRQRNTQPVFINLNTRNWSSWRRPRNPNHWFWRRRLTWKPFNGANPVDAAIMTGGGYPQFTQYLHNTPNGWTGQFVHLVRSGY